MRTAYPSGSQWCAYSFCGQEIHEVDACVSNKVGHLHVGLAAAVALFFQVLQVTPASFHTRLRKLWVTSQACCSA